MVSGRVVLSLLVVVALAGADSSGSNNHHAHSGGVRVLTEATFEHDTQAATGATTGDWFVMFSDDSCEHCHRAQPAWDQLALGRETHRTAIATVKCSSPDSSWVCKRFAVRSYPTFILFRRGKMYVYDGRRDKDSLLAFISTPTSELGLVPQVPPAEWGLVDKVISSVDDVRNADPLIFYITAGLTVITAALFMFLMCLPTPKVPRKTKVVRSDGASKPQRPHVGDAPAANAKKDQ